MKNIFPQEILDFSKEVYINHISKKNKIIYFAVTLSVFAVLVSLPFIYIDISIQAQGVIRSNLEKNKITSSVNAKILKINIAENKFVEKNEVLIILDHSALSAKISNNRKLFKEYKKFYLDLKNLINNKKRIKTNKYKKEQISYKQKIDELNTCMY